MQIKIRPPYTPKKIAFVAGTKVEEAKEIMPNEYYVQIFIQKSFNLPSIRSFAKENNYHLSHISYHLSRFPELTRIRIKTETMETVLLPEDTQKYLCGIIRKRNLKCQK